MSAMRQNRLNHNRSIMFGIMALALVVLVVVVMFWMWCFPQVTGEENVLPRYVVEIPEGTLPDTVMVQLNDSLLYHDVLPGDTLRMDIEGSAEQNLLMVTDVGEGMNYTFVLADIDACYEVVKVDGELDLRRK